MDNRQPASLARRALSYFICWLVAVQPVLPAVAAQITPVTPGTQLDAAANGVPVVNIATPNGAGVSHNQYQQYNVGQQGLILNNATGQLNQTQLGGLIQNNPHLKAGHEAQAIINEVTGANRSQLQGYTEVAGKAANVMVANPYGITCNGCGFINTPNVTLTTGRPQLDANGNLAALEVSKGAVIVEGKGLDGSSADAVSIVARATEINAGIYAKDLSMTLGANRVGADGSVTPIAGEGAAPSVAVDTGALGGMYANRIRLVSSEKGVGVNLGNLVAKQGDIQLDSSGQLTLNTSLSSGALRATAASVALGGDNKATGPVSVSAQQDVAIGPGKLVSDAGIAVAAGGNLTTTGASLTAGKAIRLSGATLSADASSQGNAGETIQLQAGNQFSNSGQFTSGNDLTVAAQRLDNRGSLAAAALTLNAATLTNSGAATVAGTGSLAINSSSLFNQGVLSAPALTINSAQTENSGLLQGANALVFTGERLNNLAGGNLTSNNGYSLTFQELNNTGVISSGAVLTLGGQRLTNEGDINAANLTLLNKVVSNHPTGSLLAEYRLQLNSSELNNSGKTAAEQLTIHAGVVSNSGTLQAKNRLETQGQQLTNSGTLLSDGQLSLSADTLSNAGSLQGQQLTLTANRGLNSGKVLSLGDASVTAESLNNSGSMLSQQALRLSSGETDNNGLIQGTKALSVTGNRLTNLAQGTVSSENSFGLDLPELNNFGLIASGGALTLAGARLTNGGEVNAADITANNLSLINQQGARLLADNALQFNNDTLTNVGDIAASQLSIHSGTVDNRGTLQGKQALLAAGQQLSNSGTLLSGGQLQLEQGSLINSGLLQGQQLSLTAADWQNSGNALSVDDAQLNAGSLTNSGKILGQQRVQLQADHTDNSGWLLAQVVTLQSDLVNSGLIQGADALTLQGGTLSNQSGAELLSAGTLDLRGETLTNQGSLQADQLDLRLNRWQNAGSAHATSQFTASLSGPLENSGSLLSENRFDLFSGSLTNSGTLAADRLAITAATLSNAGLLQGNSALTLNSAAIDNASGGQLIGGSALALSPVTLTNAGLLQVAGDFSLDGRDFSNSGTVTADNLFTTLTGTLNNGGAGVLLARQQATLHAATLDNSGTLAAQQLVTSGDLLTNRGLMQGDVTLSASFNQLTNLNAGTLLSGGDLNLEATRSNNAGVWQGSNLRYQFDSLSNSGTVNGTATLSGTTAALLDNSSLMVTQGSASLTAGRLDNAGKIMANSLLLRGDTLNNSGLWQGSTLLDVQATDAVTQAIAGKALSGGDLLLSARSLNSDGTLQGRRVQIGAESWQHQGTLLSSGDVTVSVSGELRNGGEVMSQGASLIAAQNTENSGSLLAEKAMTLQGGALNNSGTLQGETLTLTPASVINQGSLIGLQWLTLGAAAALRGLRLLVAQAQPVRVLVNNAGGQLLTQGTLSITGDNVTNNGSWQGQQILLNAASLANGGAIQSADGMQLSLRDRLTSSAGSKITANGTAALSALSLASQGEWIAKNLTLNGATLDNRGTVSGVNGLTVTLSDALTQQQNGSLLSGGRLDLQAATLSNAGRVQGGDLTVTADAVTNSGRLLGDNSLLLSASGRVTNEASGTLLSQGGLTLTAPELYNYGLIQGANSQLSATHSATNSGRLLSAGELTLNAPQLTNSGWLQATQLTLNAANASNSGTLLADGQGTLTGTQLQNQGTAQGNSLTVDYAQLNNGGTLLGVNQLNVNAAQVTQQATGRLFSGGNLLLESSGFDQLGQVVALGDATLKLINSFTARDTLAAGNRLSISSNGAIDNQGTLQGQAMTLSAGGDLTNNGQITTGTGDSSLSGNRIAMNGTGTLQGGGNVSLNSRSDITVDGFTGTLGNLTLGSPGSIVNAALLYAGQNLSLYANSIRNQRGDMLAGNSLWMQGDAAGNASAEVINTSGTIETQNGDITIKTGHLLNTRDGLQVTETETTSPARADVGDAILKLNISELPEGSYGYYVVKKTTESGGGCSGKDGGCSVHTTVTHYYAPFTLAAIQKFALTSKQVEVSSDGGAARISAGRDVNVEATVLENQASTLLAQRDIALAGNQFDNHSWQAGTQNDYLVYEYKGGAPTHSLLPGQKATKAASNSIYYTLTGHETSFTPGELYRAVIQAGGNVSARFQGDISNTETTANAEWSGNTLSAPAVAGLAALKQAETTQRQALADSSQTAVGLPAWQDRLQDALKQIGVGVALDRATADETSLTPLSGGEQNQAPLGQAAPLVTDNLTTAALQNASPAQVDISAYPLPTSSNGYFVAGDSSSPYLITVNPKLNGLGQLDSSLFGDLNALLGKQPDSAVAETRQQYTDVNAVLGSSWLLERLGLNPERDYRFLGDAAFDTRYVSNTVLNQTGQRYLNGIGSDLEQMRYLMDNAAAAQQSLGLQFGISLSAAQVALLDKSIIWWEAATIDGQTVMVPKVYLSSDDAEINNGSVIAGNKVTLSGGSVVNDGSTLTAKNDLTVDSQNRIDNLSAGLIRAGGDLQLSALGDINNVSSTIMGKKVELESLDGSINSLTTSQQWSLDAGTKSFSDTLNGQTATIASIDALSLRAGDNIALTAADLSAGSSLLLEAWNDIAINGNQQIEGQSQGGEKAGWYRTEKTSQQKVSNIGSQLAAGGDLTLKAGHDLGVTASSLEGKGNTLLAAGNDLHLNSAATGQNSSKGNKESHTADVDRTAITSGGNLTLSAGQDLTSQAAALVAEGDVALQAGRDISLNAEESRTGDSERGSKKTVINETVRQQGTEIVSGGSATLLAGNDITSQASDVTAKQNIALHAGNNIVLGAATESDYYYKEETKTKKSLFSKKTTHTIQEDNATREKGTLLSGNNVSVSAGNDLLVKGSQVVGDGKVALSAGNNVEIAAATNTDSTWRFSETRKSGLMGTGGLGISIGSSRTLRELKDKGTTQNQSVSTVGSTAGDVSITAGKQLQINGADLIAGGNMTLQGDSVAVTPGHDLRTRDERFEQRTSGLTLALSGAVAEVVNSAVAAAQSAKHESDGRLAALQATKAVLSGVQASQAGQLAQIKGDPNNGVGISVSLTTQQSKSQQHQFFDAISGSTINAGRNLSIDATGKGNGADSGDLLIAGSQLKAGGNTSLHAANDITLTGAASTQQITGKNSSSGSGVGLSFGVGSGSAGISIFASVNGAKGHEKGNGTVWSETTLDSGGDVSITSGRDTTLSGAQVNGNSVKADIGRDLTITSLQDSDKYDSKQASFGAGGSFTIGTMTGSGYINASQDKMHSNYDSVLEQSGIYAGKDGFDITVGNHTQLKGAVIASQADADLNRLDTGTLGFMDINNEADYKTGHQGIGISSGASMGGQFTGNMANTLLAGAGSKGHAEGTTQSAVAKGTVVVRDQASQQQNPTDLSRDTEHANDSISPIFNKEKEQKRLQTAQMIAEIGGQVADITRTEGQIAGEKAKCDPEKLAEARAQLAARGKAFTDEDVAKQAYNNAMAPYGTGSSLQQGIQAATAAIQGLSGGNIAQAISGAASPYLAEQIHIMTEGNAEAKAMAHAVVGAIASYASGNSAVAGAAGAISGELMAQLVMKELYAGKAVGELTETERQTISALGTLAAGLAGWIAGDSTANAVAGAQAGKNAVENNLLGGNEESQAAWIRQYGVDMASCSDKPDGSACQKAKNERDALMFALATGSVAFLPAGAQAMWGLGAGTNAGISYWADGAIDPANAAIAGWVNVYSMGNGLTGTVGWNAAGGALGNWIDDKDPLSGALINGAGSGIGYGIGRGLSWGINAGANWWKGGWDPKFNPVLQKYTDFNGEFGLSKEVKPSNIPGSFGDIGASFSSEYGGKKLEPIIEEKLK